MTETTPATFRRTVHDLMSETERLERLLSDNAYGKARPDLSVLVPEFDDRRAMSDNLKRARRQLLEILARLAMIERGER